MYKPLGLNRKSLQTQLENCKLITEINKELFDKNLFTKQELSGQLELAQNYINESGQWEELGDQTKRHESLTTASIIMGEVSAVIKHVLYQVTSPDDGSLQPDQILAHYQPAMSSP
jgi:hypothetical protein